METQENIAPQEIDVDKIKKELRKQKQKDRDKVNIKCECGKNIKRSKISSHVKNESHINTVSELDKEIAELRKLRYEGIISTSICLKCDKAHILFKECNECLKKVCRNCFNSDYVCFVCKKPKIDDNRVIVSCKENIDVNSLVSPQ